MVVLEVNYYITCIIQIIKTLRQAMLDFGIRLINLKNYQKTSGKVYSFMIFADQTNNGTKL